MADMGLTSGVPDQLRANYHKSVQAQQQNLDDAAKFLDMMKSAGSALDAHKAQMGAGIHKKIQGQADVMETLVAALSTYDGDMASHLDDYGRAIDQALGMARLVQQTIKSRAD